MVLRAARAKPGETPSGLTWNVALEAGGVLVGTEVGVVLNVQAVREAPVAA